MPRSKCLLFALICALSACGKDVQQDNAKVVLADGPKAEIEKLSAADLPAAVRAAAMARVADMTVVEAERKQRDGMVFYDVEGMRADGSEVELDILEKGGTFTVVEMQRDIQWADAPAAVRTLAEEAPDNFAPVRVIESTQNDGTVIYELFARGKKDEPAAEINWKDGKATFRKERNVY